MPDNPVVYSECVLCSSNYGFQARILSALLDQTICECDICVSYFSTKSTVCSVYKCHTFDKSVLLENKVPHIFHSTQNTNFIICVTFYFARHSCFDSVFPIRNRFAIKIYCVLSLSFLLRINFRWVFFCLNISKSLWFIVDVVNV